MNLDKARLRVKDLIEEINKHSYQYYTLASPTISDFEFDRLLKELIDLEREYPELIAPNSPSQTLVGESISEFKSVKHQFPMLSLGNTYSEQDLLDFDQRIKKIIGNNFEYVAELKFDGVAMGLTYIDGKLIRAVTRGDGISGDDVTTNIKTIPTIPWEIKALKSSYAIPQEFEIRGEIIMHRKAFEKLNLEREEEGQPPYANPRNFTAGTIKMQDPQEVRKRPLDCFLYSILGNQLPFKTHGESLKAAESWGFHISEHIQICDSIDKVLTFIHKWEKERHQLSFDIDGIVLKVNNLNQQEELGFTAKTPRWAISYKYQAEQIETELVSITYQVGRTGAITPVANLKPILLAGTTVKRATLHNFNEIERLDLRIGDTVLIEKGGEIIPKVLSVNLKKRPSHSKITLPLKDCPACGTELIREEGEAVHFCPNIKGCSPQIIGRIQHFIGRKAMDISGLGDETIEQFFKAGLIRMNSDLYGLQNHRAEILSLERFGEKSLQKLLDGIEKSKMIPFDRLLFAIGIRFVGATVAQKLAKHFKNMSSIMEAKFEQLIEVEEVGERIARSVHQYFSQTENVQEIKRLETFGLQFVMQEVVQEKISNILEGKSFLISGVFPNYSRENIAQIIDSHGGKLASGVSGNLNFLVAGENMGPSKLEKAIKLKIPVISLDELNKMVE